MSDYYLAVTDGRQIYMEVEGRRNISNARTILELMENAGKQDKFKKITRGDYNLGCVMSGLPMLGKNIEVILVA